jgi:succinoglycan biosynthesis transport protein ExoP
MAQDNPPKNNLVPFSGVGRHGVVALRPANNPNSSWNQETTRDISLSDLIRGFRQRWHIVAGVTAACALIMGLYCSTRDPLFSAESVIEIRGYAPVLAGATVENLYGADTRKLEYQKTTIAKLKQPGIADRVLSSNSHAAEIAEYFKIPLKDSTATDSNERPMNQGLRQTPKLVAKYLSTIEINPISETSLVEIQATTRDPYLSMIISNAHAEGFIEALRLERQQSMRTNIKALESQVAELREKIAKAEQEIAAYSEQENLIVSSEAENGKDMTLQKIVSITQLLNQATAKRSQSENLYNQLKDSSLDQASSLDSDSIQEWRFELHKLTGEYSALSQKVTAEYPDMIDLQSRIDSLKRSIRDERAQLRNALQIRLESERVAEQQLADQLRKEESSVHENFRKMARYTVLRKEADSLRELYEAVLKQLQETTVSAASGVSNIFVSDWASEPQSPSFPKTGLLVTLATIIGLFLGAAIAWTLEFMDNRIHSTDDVSDTTELPLLGVIPQFGGVSEKRSLLSLPFGATGGTNENQSDLPLAQTTPASVSYRQPSAVVAEALRTIRAGLLLSSIDSTVRTIVITSADKGEGKTTIAANLALSLAQADYKVLLIDADLRETSLSRLFPEIEGKRGLSEILSGQVAGEDVIVHAGVPCLDLLGSGARPPNPAEMAGSKRMRELLTTAKSRYDFVLIDTPPVLPVADTLMLSSAVDGVLMVSRSGKTTRRNLREAHRRLASVQASMVGIVLNDGDPRHEPVYGQSMHTVYGESKKSAANS